MRRGLLGALLVAAMAVGVVHAQPAPDGPEFQVNAFTTSSQTEPAVAVSPSGDFVVIWQSLNQDGLGFGIFGRRYDAAGNPLGGDFQVNTFHFGDQSAPAVAMDLSGNFVVVWQSGFSQDGGGVGVFGQRFSSAGTALGGEFQVNTFTALAQEYPDVAMDADGDFVVVWQSDGQDGSGFGVFGQRFNSSGGAVGGEFAINTHTTSTQKRPSVAMETDGDFVVVWQSQSQDTDGYGVFGQRFASDGTALGSEFLGNLFAPNNQNYPDVTVNDDGNFVVVWQSEGQDQWGYGIFGRRFDSSGNSPDFDFLIPETTVESQRFPSVDMDATGDFVVTWQSYTQDGSGEGVFGRSLDSDRVPKGGEFPVNSFTTGSQLTSSLGLDSSGRFVVVWSSPQDGDLTGIFGQRFSHNCLPIPGPIADLGVAPAGGITELHLTWSDVADAEDYVVFEDGSAGGSFQTITGTSTSGSTGLTIPMPGSLTYYTVHGRNASCGIGP
jgi:hypothetical protein